MSLIRCRLFEKDSGLARKLAVGLGIEFVVDAAFVMYVYQGPWEICRP